MELGDLIKWLEELNEQFPNGTLPWGFGRPDSFRGYYDHIAFEPKENANISDMLKHARYALNRTFTGYKGGEYTMDEYTPCWIAEYGTSEGDSIGPIMMRYWKLALSQNISKGV